MKTKVISFRVLPEELAKAIDGLRENNIDPASLTTISDVVRTTFYHGIISLCKDPSTPASQEAMRLINKLSYRDKQNKIGGVNNIL